MVMFFMKVVFSRKGFDGSAGGSPSPIIDGIPLSIPIPYLNSTKTYQHFNLGKTVADLTNKKLNGKVVTKLSLLKNYCPAEEYHQKYLDKNY